MEEQLVHLLAETQSAAEPPRKQAELHLKELYRNDAFPIGLASIASHDSIPLNIRQAALLYLRTFVEAAWEAAWSPEDGPPVVNDATKARLRPALLELATSDGGDKKVKSLASYVVSKVAGFDFPDEWPELLPYLLDLIPRGSEAQLYGALKVLSELVSDCFSEEQFFRVAPELVRILYDVATNESRKLTLRALAVSIFRSCFDILEMVLEEHKIAVKGFAEQTLSAWMPFFLGFLRSRLSPTPPEEEGPQEGSAHEAYRGTVTLKVQVVKALMRIRSLFPAFISPQSPALFSATWDELISLQAAYRNLYIEDDRQSRLEDADGMPYTLDHLVLEELDFMQSCIKAPPIRKELEKQLQPSSGTATAQSTWTTEVMKLAVAYAQITKEEEGFWEFDFNLFIAEETSVNVNYTARTACGELVMKLGEWLSGPTVDGLLAYTKTLYSTEQDWKVKEAALFLLHQLLGELLENNRHISIEAANTNVEFIRDATTSPNEFLRARGFLVGGSLTKASSEALRPISASLMEQCLHAIISDDSDVVKVACIRALQYYLQSIPPEVTLPLQAPIISALSTYLSSVSLDDLEGDDLLVTLVETLRDVILLDTRICLSDRALDLLFTIASRGATNFQITLLANETFQEITTTISALGHDFYVQLCAKVLPSLSGAFDVGNLTEENALTNLAAELLSILTEHGSSPLPPGYVSATFPRINRLLLASTDPDLLRSATTAVRYMIQHDGPQVFDWHDSATHKSGLEITLLIIDRLLNPAIVDDNAASEVGGLAAEVVEKAGAERLGPYLGQLLSAVAGRLKSAEQAQFIQSLILVFARLALTNTTEVVDFLAQVQIGGDNGLQVVMSKWLENSINFAGYEEIRQNVIALTKLYDLHDPRLAQTLVKGDLIIPTSSRIMTRSKARQNPDTYTTIPVPLKIIKVLIEELLSASGAAQNLDAAAAAEMGNGDDSGDDDWEDEPSQADFAGLGMSRKELVAFGAEEDAREVARGKDDETQEFLLGWFGEQARRAEFGEVFARLSEGEREKLRSLGG